MPNDNTSMSHGTEIAPRIAGLSNNVDMPLDGTEQRKQRLLDYEKQVEEGAIGYFAAGYALEEIQKQQLYKCRACKSFAEYCKRRFDISRSYGYRLIAYSRVHKLLGEDSKKIPERLLRPLNGLEGKDIEKVWTKAKRESHAEIPSFEKLKELADDFKAEQKQKRQNEKKAKCKENEFFSSVLNRNVKQEEVQNPVAFIMEKANGNIDKLARLYKDFSDHIEFSEEQRQTLKAQVKEWQNKILEDFSAEIGL